MTKHKQYFLGLSGATLVFLCSALLGFGVFKAEAAGTGLTIQPVKVSHTLVPGEKVSGSIYLTNAGDDEIIVAVKVEDFVPTAGSNGIQFVGRAPGASTVRDWVTLEAESDFTLKQGSAKTISYNITVPQNAEPGGHFGVAFFKATKKSDVEQLKVGTQVGMLMLVTVPGNQLQKGIVRNFSVTKWRQRPPVSFKIAFENTGTVHFEPKGAITIKNFFGKVVGTVPVEGQVVLPTGRKDLVAEWAPSSFLIGAYTADLSLYDGEGNFITADSVKFYVMPVWYIAGFLAAVIAIFFILKFIRRKLKISISFK